MAAPGGGRPPGWRLAALLLPLAAAQQLHTIADYSWEPLGVTSFVTSRLSARNRTLLLDGAPLQVPSLEHVIGLGGAGAPVPAAAAIAAALIGIGRVRPGLLR